MDDANGVNRVLLGARVDQGRFLDSFSSVGFYRPLLLCLLCNVTAGARAIGIQESPVSLQFASSPSPRLKAVIEKWVQNSADAVIAYYGSFPLGKGIVRVTAIEGRVARDGHASGWSGPLIKISVGRDATDASLSRDWILVHEMIHLGFPTLAENHHWLEEGMATYVEPFARTRAGLLRPEEAWADFVNDLPQGLPRAGDLGLDHTPTWGRTYWGGALFCFRADVEIRRRTGNRRGLEHALRAIVAAGGSIDSSWTIDRVIATGDGAVGVPVLREIYEEMKDAPVNVDLSVLWKQLGLVKDGRSVKFDDTAPLASIRRAIDGSRAAATVVQ